MHQVIVCPQSTAKSRHANTRSTPALVLTKLTYCSCAWYGFCTVKEVGLGGESFLRKCKRRGYCADQPLRTVCCHTKLFQLVVADPQHTLHSLLPPESTITYKLRPHVHNLTLPDKHCALDSCNFVTRMLYAKCY